MSEPVYVCYRAAIWTVRNGKEAHDKNPANQNSCDLPTSANGCSESYQKTVRRRNKASYPPRGGGRGTGGRKTLARRPKHNQLLITPPHPITPPTCL